MHNYTVALRIWADGEVLDLEGITNNLGITPTDTRRLGEYRSSSSVWTQSMWGYSADPSNEPKNWDSLEEGLSALLNIFMPLKKKIDEYAKKCHVNLWCGHFTSSFDGGPTLSPEILKKLGDFGVELFLDSYSSSDEEYSQVEGQQSH